MKEIHLAYPPSANRYWKIARNRVYASSEAEAYKLESALAAKFAGFYKPSDKPVGVSIAFHPKLTKEGKASKTRLDLDNCLKVCLDALNGVVWNDDSQIVTIIAQISHPTPNGGLTIGVEFAG